MQLPGEYDNMTNTKAAPHNMYRVTLDISPTMLFDTVKSVGIDEAGARFLQLMLSLSTGGVPLLDQIGAATYGVSIVNIQKTDTE